MNDALLSEQISIYSGLNRKTIPNMYGTAS